MVPNPRDKRPVGKKVQNSQHFLSKIVARFNMATLHTIFLLKDDWQYVTEPLVSQNVTVATNRAHPFCAVPLS